LRQVKHRMTKIPTRNIVSFSDKLFQLNNPDTNNGTVFCSVGVLPPSCAFEICSSKIQACFYSEV